MLPSKLILSLLVIKYAKVVHGTLTTSPNDGIHSAYVLGEGCKSDATCVKSECKIKMDGHVHKHLINVVGEFGFYFVTFKFPEFTKIEDKVFRTYLASEVGPMVTWINGLPDGTIALVCSRDDAAKGMTSAGWAALKSIGMVNPKTAYRSSHALIGYKGKWPKMMTKFKSESTGKVEVRYTYVIPPPKIEPFIQGTSLEITWKQFGTFFTDYVIHANNSLGTGVGDYKQIVNAADERAVIGPLRGNTWYTVTMQVALDSDSDQVIAQSDPYFIIVHGSTGCSKGIYKFIAKIDGRKDTWKFSHMIWLHNGIRLPEANALTGFDDVEAKPELYFGLKCKWICAGMRDLTTNQFNFTQTPPQTLLQSFDDWNQKDTNADYVKAGPSAWTALFNHGVLSPSEENSEAFKINYEGSKARYGIIMKSKTLVGYGLTFSSGNFLTAGTYHIDNNGQTVKTIGFGYILVPWYVDSEWLPWSPWNACSKTCATGTKTRNRNSTRAIGEGTQLPATAVDTGSCKIAECIPHAPGNVLVTTIAKNQLKIQWDAVPPAELSNTLDHYEYRRWKASDPASITTQSSYMTGSTVSTNVYALETYTEYCFQVNIILQGNLPGTIGNKTDPVCAYTDEDVPKAPPASIDISTHTWECLLVNWTAIPTPEARGVIIKYHIYYKLASGGGELYQSTTSNSSYQLCGLLPYTEYEVKISGFTSKGEGTPSEYSSPVRTGEYIPSEAPSIITKEHTSSTSIKIKWQALQLLDWRGIPLGYTAYYILNDIYKKTGTRYNVSSVSVPHTDLEVELIGLEKYREYVIWMAAYTVVGHGSMNSSVVKQMTDEDVPSRGPAGTTAHNSSSFSILAEWTSLETPYRLGILTQYTIFIKNLKTGVEVTKTVVPPVTSGDISGLLPFLNHSVEVAASTSKGMGPRGAPAYTLTDEYVPADPPPNFRGVNISSYDLLLHWSHIPDDKWRGMPLGYTIMFRETSSSNSVWNTSVVYGKNTLSTVIRGLTAYTNHTLRIAGFTIKGNGIFSNDIVVITAEDPPYEPPEEFQADEVNSTTAVFRWKAPPNDKVKGILRGYKIMYTPVYTDEDFESQLLVKKVKRRRRSAVVSLPIVRNQINITVGPNQYQIELKNLQGYTNYSVQILAITLHEGIASPPTYVFTEETVPAMSPMNVSGKATTYTAILVKWKHMLPAYAHGIIRGYVVYYQHGNHSEAIAFNDTQVPDREYLEIAHLKIFAWYTFQVAAHTTPGLGPKSAPIYVRTDEYLPYKAPENVTAQSFMLPHDIDVTWAPLPLKYWNGIPLGYKVVLSAISMGGVPLAKEKRFSYVQMISPHLTKCSFKNLTSFYKFGIQVNAYTKIGDGPASPLKSVETCKVANAILSSSWIDHSPLVSNNPGSAIPSGFLPKILSAALRHCSGQCIGLNIKGNAVIDYVKDGKGQPSRKRDLDELMKTMSDDTEFFFPVMKPSFANEKYWFIEIMKMEKVVLVEGEPLVNTVGGNVASSVSSLMPVLLVFVMFCFASGCVVWVMETWNRTGQFQLPTIAGVFEGFYWAWVTATTVGYGDITPASVVGKIFAMFWSVMGLILLGFLSGALSTVLTASENPIAKPSPPKTGVGMVLDTWELAVAKKKGMNVDMNFTSYSVLLDAVANGTVRYGIIDAQISKVWAPKLAKEKINVKRALDLDAALGVYAAGNARQMFACFKTYVKEEASTILNEVQAAIEKEAAKVAKTLSVSADVTLTMVPHKPEFFSWESVTMQSYVKTGGVALLVLVIIGMIYDAVKWLKSRKQMMKVIPRRARIRQRADTFSDYGSGRSSVNVNDTQEQARSSSTMKRTLSKASIHSRIYPDLSHTAQDAANSEEHEASSRPSSPFVNDNDQVPPQSKTQFNEEQQQREDPLSRAATGGEYVEQTTHSQDGFEEVVFDTSAEPDINHTFDSKSVSSEYHANSFADTSSLLAALVADVPSKPDMMQQELEMEQPEVNKPDSPLPLDSDILAFSIGGYYDNELLEKETEKLIADFEESLETMMKLLEEKHDEEREKLRRLKTEWMEQTYGGRYKYWDPTQFSAPW